MNITDTKSLTLALDLAARERIAANSITAEMDAEISAIKAQYEPKITKHQDEEKRLLACVQAYATEHRSQLLTKSEKSTAMGSHKIGWSENGGAVSFVKGKGKGEKGALAALLRVKQLTRLFIRMTPSINKEAIAEKWSVWGEKLRKCGIRYASTESFFVTLDITQTPDARVKPEPSTEA